MQRAAVKLAWHSGGSEKVEGASVRMYQVDHAARPSHSTNHPCGMGNTACPVPALQGLGKRQNESLKEGATKLGLRARAALYVRSDRL